MKATPVLLQPRSSSTLKSPGARAIAAEHERELAKLTAIYATAAKICELIDAAAHATPSKRKASTRKAITAANKLLAQAYALVPESDRREVYERVLELVEETDVTSALTSQAPRPALRFRDGEVSRGARAPRSHERLHHGARRGGALRPRVRVGALAGLRSDGAECGAARVCSPRG